MQSVASKNSVFRELRDDTCPIRRLFGQLGEKRVYESAEADGGQVDTTRLLPIAGDIFAKDQDGRIIL
jgi:hypothetical protein